MDSSTARAAGRHPEVPAPTKWSEALLGLLSARIALMQHEAQAAAGQALRFGVLIAVAAIATFFAWALLLGCGIASLAAATTVAWQWIALAAALLHALAAAICLQFARSATFSAFSMTRAEFHKDREWLKLQTTPRKSND